MIKQQILFDGEEILKIYHKGFTDYPMDRKLNHKQNINNHTLELKESFIQDISKEEVIYDDKIVGFLHKEHGKNPYSTYCCNYTEFINYDKGEFIDELIEDKKTFGQVKDFIEQMTGIKLDKSPYIIFNTLIFTPTDIELDMRLDKENPNNIQVEILTNPYFEHTLIIKFKMDNIIVDTKTYKNKIKAIETDCEWNKVDIDIYHVNGNLIYSCYNISFIKSINISMNLLSKKIQKQLNTEPKKVSLNHITKEDMQVGSIDSSNIIDYLYQEELNARMLKDKRLFEFLGRNQYDRALEIFEEIASTSGYEEMWIFDPYFIDYGATGGKKRLEDIVSILSTSLSLKKNIVFKCDDDYRSSFNNFLSSIEGLRGLVKNTDYNKLNMTFYGTSESFHDRFIIFKNNLSFKGYILGTSFNSFGDNYSTILEIEEKQAEVIFNTFDQGVLSKILLEESL